MVLAQVVHRTAPPNMQMMAAAALGLPDLAQREGPLQAVALVALGSLQVRTAGFCCYLFSVLCTAYHLFRRRMPGLHSPKQKVFPDQPTNPRWATYRNVPETADRLYNGVSSGHVNVTATAIYPPLVPCR